MESKDRPMGKTRVSLFYLVSYLTFGGVALLIAPQKTMELFFATGSYADLMLRVIGTFMLAIAVIIAQIIRTHASQLYSATLIVRCLILTLFVAFYCTYRDPFLLVLAAVVGLGLAVTSTAFFVERRKAARRVGQERVHEGNDNL